jgi:hypothetical protein
LQKLRDRFNLKNIKIIGEAASAAEEAAEIKQNYQGGKIRS